MIIDDYYDEDFDIDDYGGKYDLEELEGVEQNLQAAIDGNEEQTQILRTNLITIKLKIKELEKE